MVNASLNWASIVGIVLAVCGGGLYFLRSFKPALARDYDVFFAAIGLLCGGILFFQGWRLDPILQFGQFLLAGTTVFFAYESVRLRGIATDQARRSSFFDDDQVPSVPRNPSRDRWDEDYDQFDQPERISRRFRSRDLDVDDTNFDEDRFRSRRVSRVIPESAASRRRPSPIEEDEYNKQNVSNRRRFQSDRKPDIRSNKFGERRNTRNEIKRGSRPLANENTSRQSEVNRIRNSSLKSSSNNRTKNNIKINSSQKEVEDASFIQNNESKQSRSVRRSSSNINKDKNLKTGRYSVGSKKEKPRDNSGRFDD